MGKFSFKLIMRDSTRCIILSLTFCCLFMTGTNAIYCSQCSSLDDPLCGLGLVLPTKCQGSAVACLTYKGEMPMPGADIVIRDCADKDHGNFCQDVPSGPGSFAHSFCVSTCHVSGCNDIHMRIPPTEKDYKFESYVKGKLQ